MFRFDPVAVLRHYASQPCSDPACEVDRLTSMADARIAIGAAQGVDLDDIDPASGYDYSRRAYDNVRRSWIVNIKYHGWSPFYEQQHLDKALASWTEHRPEFTAGDDWLAAGIATHRAYWSEIGRPCNRGSCVLHESQTAPGAAAA
ncbi:hypothetical protein [Streptomyces yunnanensis]|uniref:Uncharacterized protein n=1 Tax=Streptomyces yunnanensis TaxID=156453 RepID=A0A9X8MT57_9ACTN|nr:hypothetical protein [Streptomyces yunnanensis]SHL74186.1 hypothetical protein SAMN05216268_10641 [Streptomyces yunnanensis]